ncbi:MAG: AmmeMemoRadiSam system protein A [Sulfuricurvum sp.]|jgi:hypothetical protein|uniref:AmmeMemoRadiSam system protein A n=1 Tax=Sulfuricurvum sp. TaxID=2025608 RepID=UPI0025F7B5BF|nr:AmmeMemoRadiSam system protein A [Sulfuricurvum sp.]MCK9372956.1 AmmeMemoRadiSam system protein A [Sulfuricurvum sp.]
MVPQYCIQIAKDAIGACLEGRKIDKGSLLSIHPELSEKKATFVTLTLHGHLRGCIGSLIAHRPLLDDLISNAESAAFHDPRFPPLNSAEADAIQIEVSLLTDPQSVEYRDEDELKKIIRPGIDGVILRYGNHQATFLPQVWEELNDFETFFAHLGMKAGINANPIAYHPEIYTYQVDKIKEN